MRFIDTHAHIDTEDFKEDLPEVVARARAAGIGAVFLPCIDLSSLFSMAALCRDYPGYFYQMIGLHPEEVKADYDVVLEEMKSRLDAQTASLSQGGVLTDDARYIAIGECGLDFYWTRENEREQLLAFESQVKWSVEYRLPLVIHCRKAQNELLGIMRPYSDSLPGGVFHCFTGNRKEAEQFLSFENFCLGIGGVSTFKSSHLREDLPAAVPMNRIVIETDSPYMAPVPLRGKRNESAFSKYVLQTLAQAYGMSEDEVARQTNENVERIFSIRPEGNNY